MTNNIHIILDAGHGNYDTTHGKYSPVLDSGVGYDENTCYEGRFREGMFNRDIVKRLVEKLTKLGINVHVVSDINKDVSLSIRVNRANEICKQYGVKNCLFLSIHSNAAGNGTGWLNARGTSVHVCEKCSTTSKELARTIYEASYADGFKGNRSVPICKYWVNNFKVVRETICPAVLIENLFYDNREDIKVLMSEEGRERIAMYIFKGLMNFLEKYK